MMKYVGLFKKKKCAKCLSNHIYIFHMSIGYSVDDKYNAYITITFISTYIAHRPIGYIAMQNQLKFKNQRNINCS